MNMGLDLSRSCETFLEVETLVVRDVPKRILHVYVFHTRAADFRSRVPASIPIHRNLTLKLHFMFLTQGPSNR